MSISQIKKNETPRMIDFHGSPMYPRNNSILQYMNPQVYMMGTGQRDAELAGFSPNILDHSGRDDFGLRVSGRKQ